MKRTACSILLLALLAGSSAHAQFGKNKISYEQFDWRVYQSPHFDVHYYPSIEPFLEEIVSYAESAYLEMSRRLDHELRFRVPLILYKTHGEFVQTNITLAEVPQGAGAFAEPVQNRMVLPIDLPPDKLYELIAHELTHIFQYSIFYAGNLGRALRSNVPTWLMEGMASYLANDEDSIDQMVLRDAVVNNILPPIESLNVVTFLTYRYGHAIFDFIEEEHGLDGLRHFIFEYRKVLLTDNVERAVREAFGYDMGTFNRRFNRYLRKKYFPVLLEKKSPDDYGTEIALKAETIMLSPTMSPSGELVAVLAAPKMELDLVVVSADDGKKVKNLTKGWTNDWIELSAAAFEGKRDLSWSPVSDEIAVFARRENRWPLLVIDALGGDKVHDIVFPDIFECASPAFSPDGKKVAFEGNREGVVDIFEVDLETREVRNLTQDDAFDANPWYSADGQSLLYNRRIGPYWKIFSVSTSDPERKTQITFGESSDVQPSWSRDEKRIWFSSDRGEFGVFNVWGMDVETGELEQYTDVVGGCFAPVEMAERGGDRRLVFNAFFGGTFRLYRMPALQAEEAAGEAGAEAEAPPDQDAEAEAAEAEARPFEPPLNLQIDDEHKVPYRARWDVEAPSVAVGVTDDGTFLSNAYISFSDLLGNQRLQVVASSVEDFANYAVTYLNVKRRWDWGAAVYDYHDYFFRRDAGGGVDREESYRATGAYGFVQFPISRYYRVETALGALDRSETVLVPDPSSPDPLVPGFRFEDVDDLVGTVEVSLTGDTTRYQSFGPFQGKRFTIGTLYGPHLSGDFDGNIVQHRLDFRAYRQLTRRSVFATRVASIYNTGDRETYYGFGGLNQLRGYEFREFFGSRLAWANFELRFPLVEDLRFPFLRIAPIRGFLFADVGGAWLDDGLFYDPEFQVNPFAPPGSLRVDENGMPLDFEFWDSENDRFQDGRASYGMGFQFLFFGGLQFNWVWSHPMDYTRLVPTGWTCSDPLGFDCLPSGIAKVKQDGGGTRMDFYITFDF
jgi:hypothetical protein